MRSTSATARASKTRSSRSKRCRSRSSEVPRVRLQDEVRLDRKAREGGHRSQRPSIASPRNWSSGSTSCRCCSTREQRPLDRDGRSSQRRRARSGAEGRGRPRGEGARRRPAAVLAAVAKFYRGEPFAFGTLEAKAKKDSGKFSGSSNAPSFATPGRTSSLERPVARRRFTFAVHEEAARHPRSMGGLSLPAVAMPEEDGHVRALHRDAQRAGDPAREHATGSARTFGPGGAAHAQDGRAHRHRLRRAKPHRGRRLPSRSRQDVGATTSRRSTCRNTRRPAPPPRNRTPLPRA